MGQEQQESIEEEDVILPNEPEHKESGKFESREVDLDKVGNVEVKSGGTKPIFKAITKMVIKKVTVKQTDEKAQKSRDGKSEQRFTPIFLNVEFEYMDNGEAKKSYENYGGGRMTVDAKTLALSIWAGEGSAFGKITQLLKDNFTKFAGTLKEYPQLLTNLAVGVKTEEMTISGETYSKNMIKVIYQ